MTDPTSAGPVPIRSELQAIVATRHGRLELVVGKQTGTPGCCERAHASLPAVSLNQEFRLSR